MNLNNFGPFSSDVWGTVSDWAMVIVTGSTLFYIIRTFRSQYEVQKLQQKSTNIENEKFRIQITPIFELVLLDQEFNFIESNVEIKMTFDFQPVQNDCFNLNIEVSSILSSVVFKEDFPNKDLDYIALNGHRGLYLIALIEKKLFDIHGCNFQVDFTYSDIIGNRYQMNFWIFLTYSDKRIKTNGPFRILV